MAVKKNDPYGSDTTNDELLRRRAARLDSELQPDPELAEGPASGGRIALFAIAIVAIIGVVFYGLNHPSVAPTSTAQTTTTAPISQPSSPPGQTTGSATSTQTSPPPASTPPAVNQPTDRSSDTSAPTSMTPAPSPSNGGTTQSGPPANN